MPSLLEAFLTALGLDQPEGWEGEVIFAPLGEEEEVLTLGHEQLDPGDVWAEYLDSIRAGVDYEGEEGEGGEEDEEEEEEDGDEGGGEEGEGGGKGGEDEKAVAGLEGGGKEGGGKKRRAALAAAAAAALARRPWWHPLRWLAEGRRYFRRRRVVQEKPTLPCLCGLPFVAMCSRNLSDTPVWTKRVPTCIQCACLLHRPLLDHCCLLLIKYCR